MNENTVFHYEGKYSIDVVRMVMEQYSCIDSYAVDILEKRDNAMTIRVEKRPSIIGKTSPPRDFMHP